VADTQVMFTTLLALLRDLLRPRDDLILENLALRQQILIFQRTNPKLPFRDRDRAFWVVLCHWWDGWRRPR
jgi:putative transposase